MKSIKAILFVLVAGAAILVGIKVVPVYFNYYQFQDAIESEARLQSYSTKSADDMRESMWKKAQELDLPIASMDDIKVERNGPTVSISTQYTVHIDIPLHPFDLSFAPSTSNKRI